MSDREKARRLYELNFEKEQLDKALARKVAEHGSLSAPQVVGCSEVLDRVIAAIYREEAEARRAG